MGNGRGREVGVPVRYVEPIAVREEQTRVVVYRAPSREAAGEEQTCLTFYCAHCGAVHARPAI